MEVFGFIYSLLKAIPVVDNAIRGFIAYYYMREINEKREGLSNAIVELDKAQSTEERREALRNIARNSF